MTEQDWDAIGNEWLYGPDAKMFTVETCCPKCGRRMMEGKDGIWCKCGHVEYGIEDDADSEVEADWPQDFTLPRLFGA
jgi:hypothetical protein